MFDKEDEKAKEEYPEDYLLGYKHGRQGYLDCLPREILFKERKSIKNDLQKLSWTLGVWDGYTDELGCDNTIK